jgi:ketosteroid isomerase-like protein
MDTMNKIETEVWAAIQEMNRLWTIENRADELSNYFHESMVVINPTDNERISGGKNCVEAWKNFTIAAKIFHWVEIDPLVQIYGAGNFAVVTYYFDMSFEISGQKIDMKGRDMFTLIKEDDRWWIIADQFSPNPRS